MPSHIGLFVHILIIKMKQLKGNIVISLNSTAHCSTCLTLTFGDEAVATVNVINHALPTNLLKPSPYEVLFKHKPNYSEFRTFGCACSPFLSPFNKHKLQYRLAECTFLGYGPHHKGYRCLDANGRIYISKD